MNYNVIGSDGAVYGPVDTDTLKKWAAEGRVMPNSMIEEVGSGRRFAANTMPGLFPATQPTAHQFHSAYDTPVQSPVSPAQPGQTGPGGPGAAYPRAGAAAVGYSSVTSGQPIPNNLVKAIFSTLCCCLPLGIVSIIYAAQVRSKQDSGDYYGATESANKANQFANISIGLGIVGVIINIVFRVLAASVLHK